MRFLVELVVLSLWAVESRCVTAETRLPSPVQIGLFYEAHCPDCRGFLVNQLCPTWQKMKEIVNITLIPFGNAKEIQEGQKWQFRCQHGQQECQENTIQTCMMHYLKKAASYLPVICCIASAPAGLAGAQKCLQVHAPTVSWDTILSCANGDQGNELMHQNAQMTNELELSQHYVPWVLINGEHTLELQFRARTELFSLACKTYTGSPPEVCDRRDDI